MSELLWTPPPPVPLGEYDHQPGPAGGRDGSRRRTVSTTSQMPTLSTSLPPREAGGGGLSFDLYSVSSDPPCGGPSSSSLDSEDQFFLREARVIKDILAHLTEDDSAGFDDVLFITCQGFLKSHHTAVTARRDLRKKIQDRAARIAEKRRYTTFWSRTLLTLDDPRSSFKAFCVFVTVATLVVASCVSTIVSTLPAYNPIVKEEYLILWNVVDLGLGLAFTVETGLRFLASVLDKTMPTSPWQNAYRFFTKPSNLVDLVSIAPSYVHLMVSPKSRVITGTLRTVRLLRLFKILRFYKPVRMLQKALRFAAKGLIAPILFLVTTLVFISAGAYFAESGEYDAAVHQFLLDNDPVCKFEPSYFLSLSQRAPNYIDGNQTNTSSAAPSTPTPLWHTLPPGATWSPAEGGDGTSDGKTGNGGGGTESVPNAVGLGPVIDHLTCPVTQSSFITIVQSSWWAIATMSSVGFGDLVTVTAAGRILAVFGILAGIILNAMPIAVIDASFVTTLQTEEDQELREKTRKKRDDATVKLGGGVAAERDAQHSQQLSSSGGIRSPPLLRLDDERASVSSAGLDVSLLDRNPSFFVRSVAMEQESRDRQMVDDMTARTQAELFLLHLQLLSKAQVIDLANPSDSVLYLVDTLLEAAVTNTAADLATWHNKKFRHMWGKMNSPGGGGGGGGGVRGTDCNNNNDSNAFTHSEEELWCPQRLTSLPLCVANTSTNVAREAQVLGLVGSNPLGEQREVFTQRTILSNPLRIPVGASSNLESSSMHNNEGLDGDGDDLMRSSSHSRGDDSSMLHQLLRDGPSDGPQAIILDSSLLRRLQKSRSEAIARSMLLTSRSSVATQAQRHHRDGAADSSDEDGVIGGSPPLASSSPWEHRPLSRSSNNNNTRFLPIDFSSLLNEHCWIVLHQAWGRSAHLLVPRRPPAALTPNGKDINCGVEDEPNTVQILRFQHHTGSWELLVPFQLENRICLAAPAGTLHKFRSRVSAPRNQTDSGAATFLCSARDQLQVSRGTTLSTRGDCVLARQLLLQLRRRSHFDTMVTMDKQLAASRMTYRAQRQAKEQEESKKARSAKAKKDAETRELLDALSSEKKEAYALLQRLDMDVGSSTDRLSLLALASTAADKLERERAAERSIAMKRFAITTRVCSEEQSPRYLLEPGDIILMLGGMGGDASNGTLAMTAKKIAMQLPSHGDVLRFALTRRSEFASEQRTTSSSNLRSRTASLEGGRQAKGGSTNVPWTCLDGLSPLLGNTLMYVYTGE